MASDSREESGKSSSSHRKKSSKQGKGIDEVIVKAIKHYDVFYNQAPPGMVQDEQEKPEDCIPDLPENQQARDFLAKAPTKGLWMPLGKEVKVMKCWRCKAYGHRTGDKECPMFISGNKNIEQFRYSHEDPMHDFIQNDKKKESLEKVRQLQLLLEESTDESDSESSSSSSSSSTTSSSSEGQSRKRKRRRHDSSSSTSSSKDKKHKKKSKKRSKKGSSGKKKKHHKHSKSRRACKTK